MAMSIEERIARLEDIEAIKVLKARYFHACDKKDVAAIRDCFVDGELLIDYGAVGVFKTADELITLFEKEACHPHIVDTHHGQNPQVEWIDAQNASAVWDLHFHQINTERKSVMRLGGSYQDKFVKTEAGWKISETIFTVHSTLISSFEADQLSVVVAAGIPA